MIVAWTSFGVAACAAVAAAIVFAKADVADAIAFLRCKRTSARQASKRAHAHAVAAARRER